MGELRQLNEQNKVALWAERVADCRNSGKSVLAWCRENGVCSQTYYKWQKRLYALAEEQRETRFVEVTPVVSGPISQQIAVTVHIAGATADIHAGADRQTVETVLQVLKLC